MQIVIDIPEDVYKEIQDGKMYRSVYDIPQESVKAIKNGTLLPIGHGRLIDADDCLAKAWQNFYEHEDEMEKKDKDYILIHRLFEQNGFEVCQQAVVYAPTILEADKGDD